MKTQSLTKVVAIGLLAAFFSCRNDEDRLTLQDTYDISEEVLIDSYFQDVDDMAGVAVESPSDDEFSSGRAKMTITINDIRFRCNGQFLPVIIETSDDSTPEHPKGSITVDFSDGCVDIHGNIRAGKLVFTYNGRRFSPGSIISVTGIDYTFNGIKLEGIRTLTNKTSSTMESPTFNAVLTNGKATFKDGRIATRNSDITWTWVRESNPADNKLVISKVSTASGTTRAGRNYQVSVLEDLEYKRFCGLAVTGIKNYVFDGDKEIMINYGNGDCDKAIAVTVNGVTRSITVN